MGANARGAGDLVVDPAAAAVVDMSGIEEATQRVVAGEQRRGSSTPPVARAVSGRREQRAEARKTLRSIF